MARQDTDHLELGNTVHQLYLGAYPTETAGCLVRIYPMNLDEGLIHLSHDRCVIGRDEACELHIPDDSVSRQHATVTRVNGQYWLMDLKSTNGTFVNDQRVQSTSLQAGDRIRIGNQIYKFLSADDVETQYHETVYNMVTRDGLTGTFNRRYLLDMLTRETDRSLRYQRPLTLAMFDLDRFKQVNDNWGHLTGDEVLQEVIRRVQSSLRAEDVLARYGGEEFAVIVCETSLQNAARVAERWRKVIAETPVTTTRATLQVTISVGLAELDRQRRADRDTLIDRADAKLYEAKAQGRNRVCW